MRRHYKHQAGEPRAVMALVPGCSYSCLEKDHGNGRRQRAPEVVQLQVPVDCSVVAMETSLG